LSNINVGKLACPVCGQTVWLKYELAGDLMCGSQQLLWPKQVTIIGFIYLDNSIDEYQTSVAWFRYAVCQHRCLTGEVGILLQCPYSFLQQMHTVSHSVNFLV